MNRWKVITASMSHYVAYWFAISFTKSPPKHTSDRDNDSQVSWTKPWHNASEAQPQLQTGHDYNLGTPKV